MKNKAFILLLMLITSIQCFAEDLAIKEDEKSASEKCYEYLFAMPALLPIANKMSFPSIQNATFEQLANTDKATDQEKPLIAKFAEGSKICAELEASLVPIEFTETIKTINDQLNARTSSLIDLYNQKISYGEYIKQRKEKSEEISRAYEAAKAEYNAQMAANNARQDAQRRKEFSDALGNISNSIRNSMPPRAVNCNPNGLGGIRCQ